MTTAAAEGNVAGRLSFVDRHLAVWILAAMAWGSAWADWCRAWATRWPR